MSDWFTDEYKARRDAEFVRIRAKHPALVDVPFECLAGWFPIIEVYLDEVARLLGEHPGAHYELRQVKEKFAGLRLYARSSDDIAGGVKAAYDKAAKLSEETCEICGKPGVLRIDRGYFMTRCDAHSNGVEPYKRER